MVKIAVSRGHGRSTLGKRSPAGEREWYFNDKVADAFESEIQKYQNVQLNRVSDPNGYTDTPLLTRTNSANRWGATLYVAFHHNALAGRWGRHGGSEVWVRPGAPQAAKLARNVAPRVARAMNIRNRGVKAGNLHEVREPNQHAILIEGGFMDSTIDITAMRRNDMLAAQGRAVAEGVASYYGLKKKSGNSAAKKQSKPVPKKSAPKKSSGSKSISKMADEVIAGQHGSGHANRQRSLGVDNATYQKVRAEVNRRAGVTSAPKKSAPKKSAPKKQSKSISQMADEVEAGKHGTGHANRRRSLGVNQATYNKIRAEVNRRAGGGSSAPRGKSISQMAKEVLNGQHGNGHANRQRSLGVDNATYQKVRAEVNRRS